MEEPQRRGGRMNKSAGTVCKECIAHHYWHHMDDPKFFFKVMIGDFKNGVIIPKRFVANMREQISEEVTLEVPDGKTYTVEVAEEQQNELVLRSGWAEFASAYGLEQSDLLVFENSGNSHFTVRIFDRSGCEKELSCVLLDSIPCMQERKGSHGKQMQSPTGKRLPVGSPSNSTRKTPKMNPTDSPSSQKKTEHVPSSEGIHQEPISSGASQKLIKSCIALPAGCSMTSEQEAKVTALEQKIQPKVPFYITAMYKESFASGILAINKNYVMEHLANESGTIQLCQLDGSKVWTIHLLANGDGDYAVSSGWMDFIRDNKLGEGDVCIFQPARSKNDDDRVKLIFRTLEESCCLQPPGQGHVSPSKRHGVGKPAYMLPRYTSLTDEQSKKVEDMVGAIRSEIPVYVAVMKNSNVSRMGSNLGIGLAYAREYLPGGGGGGGGCCEKELRMRMRLRRKHNAWDSEFLVKYGRRQIHGKGWREFVSDNKLKRDDICLFSLVMKNTETLTMDVHIIRKRSV